MELSFGELRLADFDTMELSNMNRIRTGGHNLDVPEAVAREIVEIDPFLEATIFKDGLNEGNIKDFFEKDEHLLLLVEECDGLDMKIIGRQKAKALKIPFEMDTSDRGMVDVERFDLELNRPILQGLLIGLETEKVKVLKTNQEKVPQNPSAESLNRAAALQAHIRSRMTNRNIEPKEAVDKNLLGELIQMRQTVDLANLKFITDEKEIKQ